MTSPENYRRGVIAMSLSMAVLLVNDSIVKLVTARMPSDQIIFTRGIFVVLYILVWLLATQRSAFRHLASRSLFWVAGRGFMDAGASFSWVASLIWLPLANGTAITLAGPLILTGLAMLFLRERVGWHHWAGTVAGLLGVLLIIQPSGEAFNAASLLALLSTLLVSTRDAITRRIGFVIPSILLTLGTGTVTSVLAGIVGLYKGWPPVEVGDVALLAFAAFFIIAAQQLSIIALRAAEASQVAPFRYTSMLWAMFFGYVLWGDVPNLLAFAGMAVVVLSGLYLLHRQRVVQRIAQPAAAE